MQSDTTVVALDGMELGGLPLNYSIKFLKSFFASPPPRLPEDIIFVLQEDPRISAAKFRRTPPQFLNPGVESAEWLLQNTTNFVEFPNNGDPISLFRRSNEDDRRSNNLLGDLSLSSDDPLDPSETDL
jgi:hypothetical protein